MDRDIALALVEKLGIINTGLTALSANTLPASENSAKNNMRLDPEDVEPMTEDPEPEPEPETRKK